MNWKKLNPWNWFKNEEQNDSSNVPVHQRGRQIDSLAAMHSELDRMFDSFVKETGFTSLNSKFDSLNSSHIKPSVDISEKKGEYNIRVELPGVEKEDINVKLDKDTLEISGEKRHEKETDEKGYHCVESSYGSFRRLISLPEDADGEKLDATFKNGVLTLSVPRYEKVETNVKEISIH